MKKNDSVDELFDRIGVPEAKRALIKEKLNEKLSYKPKIGVFGKTGVGKSSLCNALFGQGLCEISDVKACTRNPQEVFLNLGGKGLTLLDVPGVGESEERDKEYGELYASLLPELDLALWVIKADDRAFASDELFYKNIVKPHIDEGKPFFFVLNQVDKIEPFREWNEKEHRPGKTQFTNIDKKIEAVSLSFECPKGWVVPVSANEKYNLNVLVDSFIFALPREQKFTVGRNIVKENVSKKAEKQIKESGWDIFKECVTDIWQAGKDFVDDIKDAVFGLGEQIKNTFCFITTATCETLGKPDNCYELNLFRNFRDNWLAKQPDGKVLIDEYYHIAPQIVSSINNLSNSKFVYENIWNDYLSNCLSMIENNELQSCKDRYIEMVRNLERMYILK